MTYASITTSLPAIEFPQSRLPGSHVGGIKAVRENITDIGSAISCRAVVRSFISFISTDPLVCSWNVRQLINVCRDRFVIHLEGQRGNHPE